MAEHTVTEEWRPVVGFEGRYEVSDRGRVRAISANTISRFGAPVLLKFRTSRHEKTEEQYLCVGLKRQGSDRIGAKSPFVHALVLEAFVGPRPAGGQCNHKNGDKSDNRPENLEWVTNRENMRHSVDVLGQRRGGSHVNSVLTDEQAREIKRLAWEGKTKHKDIAARFGTCVSNVSLIKHGAAWKHLNNTPPISG